MQNYKVKDINIELETSNKIYKSRTSNKRQKCRISNINLELVI